VSTILVVDDDGAIRELVATILEDDGYTVVTAEDGFDALAKLSERRVDLVVCDVMMPRMSGFQVVAELRRRGLFLPVILMSAAPQYADQLGGITFLRKPLAFDALADAIAQELPPADG
jgi:twitching motility two-component system response regulator PilG